MLGKKLCCVKVLWIAEAVKAKLKSSKRFQKSGYFAVIYGYCIIKIDVLIFKIEHRALNYFIDAEAGILDLFLI